jgi:hypothetical protein
MLDFLNYRNSIGFSKKIIFRGIRKSILILEKVKNERKFSGKSFEQ